MVAPEYTHRFVDLKIFMKKFVTAARPSVALSIIVIVLFFSTVYVRYGGQIILTDSSISLPSAAMVVFFLGAFIANCGKIFGRNPASRVEALKKVATVILDWLPFPMLLFVYENLKGRIWIIAAHDYTPWLAKTDLWMFHCYPTVVMEKIYHPVLTDIMAFCYALYFIMPFIVTVLLYLKRRHRDFQLAAFIIIMCFYLGFVGYISLPGVIPKFYLRHLYTYEKIPSLFLHSLMDRLYEKANAAEIWGAFPSLHVGISSVGLMISYYFKGLVGRGRGLFWIFLPFTIILWISTVYLRYHWIIDIYAGWVLAVFVFFAGKWLFNKWEKFVVRVSFK